MVRDESILLFHAAFRFCYNKILTTREHIVSFVTWKVIGNEVRHYFDFSLPVWVPTSLMVAVCYGNRVQHKRWY